MLDTTEMRFYALLGAGLALVAICLYLGLPIEQILQLLLAFGIGGALPSPAK